MKLTAKNLWDLKDKYENACIVGEYRMLINMLKKAAKSGETGCNIMFANFVYLDEDRVLKMLIKRGFTVENVGFDYSSSFKRIGWHI